MAGELLWEADQLAVLTDAVERVRAGEPTLLVIEGEAGTGKSTLLAELDLRLKGFSIREAVGVESGLPPYGVAAQWGAAVPAQGPGGLVPPFAAAQYLRELTDELAPGPVLLRLDDLQWADTESVQALTWLMRRAHGDRLLAAVTSRPLGGVGFSEWRRWTAEAHQVLRVTLNGFSERAGRALITRIAPQLTAAVAGRLLEHTGGNPLYLTALLQEYSVRELTTMPALPAPAEYVQVISNRLARQPDASVRLARAAATLGSGAVPLLEAAAVSGLVGQPDLVQPLVDAGLVTVKGVAAAGMLQWTHALVRAAIYQQMPPAARRALHAAAANVVTGRSGVFAHRIAATEQYDDELAAELDDYAAEVHRQRSHRLAGQYFRSASVLSSARTERQRRWLESAFDAVLAHDLSAVEADLPDIQDSSDVARRTLVEGAFLVLRGDYHAGVQLLAEIVNWPPEIGDRLTRFRIEMLLAWARVIIGQDTALIGQGLQRGDELGVADPSVVVPGLVARAHFAARTGGWGAFAAQLDQLPMVSSATPPPLSGLLTWRGGLRMYAGDLRGGIEDFREAQKRLHATQVDVVSNGVDGMLGMAYWLNGQWDLALVNFNLADEMPPGSVGLLMYATRPLYACGLGDFAAADRQLADAEAVLSELAWQEAVQLHVVARAVRAHAGGSSASQHSLLAEVRDRWPAVPLAGGMATGWLLVHIGWVMIWARELDAADDIAGRLMAEAGTSGSVNLSAAAAWLAGLIAEARGFPALALGELRSATAALAATRALPLYRGHMWADLSRIARQGGHTQEADTAHRHALDLYTSLGAAPYVHRLAAVQPSNAPVAQDVGSLLLLTDRERDVLTLAVEGYSYAQISRDLFITQSTVSYHLGNIYAKVGVKSRHALTEWVRSHPGTLTTTRASPGAQGRRP